MPDPIPPRRTYTLRAPPGARSSRARNADAAPARAMQARVNYAEEARRRSAAFPIELKFRDISAQPPGRSTVGERHVRQVLANMFGGDARRFTPEKLFSDQEYYATVHAFSGFRHGPFETRFDEGVVLRRSGRELLARHYARKCDAQIRFHDEHSGSVAGQLAQVVEFERRIAAEGAREDAVAAPRELRAAHYFGHGGTHATLVIYVSRPCRPLSPPAPGKPPEIEEAVMLFDSAQRPDTDAGVRLARDAPSVSAPGRPIPVYQHVWGLQTDVSSCWLYAMKAAAVLTGRHRDADGELGAFIRPDLLGALDARRVSGPAPEGVIPVWSLPELARMGQSLDAIAAHAGEDADTPLVTSKRGESLRAFLERFTYAAPGAPAPDYMREKGMSVARIIDIEDASDQIRRHVGADNWGEQRQAEFARNMKRLVDERAGTLDIDDALDNLQQFWDTRSAALSPLTDHRDFLLLAKSAYARLECELIDLGAMQLTSLLGSLSPGGLADANDYLDLAVSRLERFASALEDFAPQFLQRHESSRRPAMPSELLGTEIAPGFQDVLSRHRELRALAASELDFRRPPFSDGEPAAP